MWRKTILLLGSIFLLTPSAWANRLHQFIYDPPTNQIEFSLSGDTEPKGVVLFNPLRIVIDLPNVDYNGGTIKRKIGDRIESVRIGKSEQNTTRLVLEFAPEVQFDASSLRLKTDNSGKWTMQLPPQAATTLVNSNFMQPVSGTITDGFGYRTHPITGDRRFHKGIDIAAPLGTPIWAVADGTVITAGWEDGYGNYIEILHPDGTVTLYAHAHRLLVQKGQQIKRGEAIAEVGSTGRSSAPHLHFEVRPDGKSPTDPNTYLANGKLMIDLSRN
jgi:murein DD-endopeptidase MepM/ murein hydrolase activator NlpD